MSVQEVFTDIYASNRWGGPGEGSGSGSGEAQAEAYAAMVKRFVAEHGVSSILDVGCGDFRVGRKLIGSGATYVGVDVVEPVIRRNQERFGGQPGVSFRCLDAIRDPLPGADLCLVRQVLQHLSNDQIAAILKKLEPYPYVMITEHYPAASVKLVPNRDKPHGEDTRVVDDSAVCLDRPPFNVNGAELVLAVDAVDCLANEGETIRTYLVKHC